MSSSPNAFSSLSRSAPGQVQDIAAALESLITKPENVWPKSSPDDPTQNQLCRLILDESSTISTSTFNSLVLRHP